MSPPTLPAQSIWSMPACWRTEHRRPDDQSVFDRRCADQFLRQRHSYWEPAMKTAALQRLSQPLAQEYQREKSSNSRGKPQIGAMEDGAMSPSQTLAPVRASTASSGRGIQLGREAQTAYNTPWLPVSLAGFAEICTSRPSAFISRTTLQRVPSLPTRSVHLRHRYIARVQDDQDSRHQDR